MGTEEHDHPTEHHIGYIMNKSQTARAEYCFGRGRCEIKYEIHPVHSHLGPTTYHDAVSLRK